ncbi:MAG: hypothetical protein M1831_005909 [Alyxoria varia]|nr:MAG: hypothetical protein M1831_005909 [Alyxoria varia]
MVTNGTQKQLHWTQRIAMIRHNLHTASRSGDFSFFKILQAETLIAGTDHVGNLSAIMDGDVDSLLHDFDNLNSGIACVHEDAFKGLYDAVHELDSSTSHSRSNSDESTSELGPTDVSVEKSVEKNGSGSGSSGGSSNEELAERRAARLRRTAARQREFADNAIDKMMSSASMLIQEQPSAARESATQVLIMGTTFIADAVQVSLAQMNVLDKTGWRPAGAEACLAQVQGAVSAAVSALKGILNMLDNNDEATEAEVRSAVESRRASVAPPRRPSVSSEAPSGGPMSFLRRMSTAMTAGPAVTSPPLTRKTSTVSFSASPFQSAAASGSPATGNNVANGKAMGGVHGNTSDSHTTSHARANSSGNGPRKLNSGRINHSLATIPPTPAAFSDGPGLKDPFESAFTQPSGRSSTTTTPGQQKEPTEDRKGGEDVASPGGSVANDPQSPGGGSSRPSPLLPQTQTSNNNNNSMLFKNIGPFGRNSNAAFPSPPNNTPDAASAGTEQLEWPLTSPPGKTKLSEQRGQQRQHQMRRQQYRGIAEGEESEEENKTTERESPYSQPEGRSVVVARGGSASGRPLSLREKQPLGAAGTTGNRRRSLTFSDVEGPPKNLDSVLLV